MKKLSVLCCICLALSVISCPLIPGYNPTLVIRNSDIPGDVEIFKVKVTMIEDGKYYKFDKLEKTAGEFTPVPVSQSVRKQLFRGIPIRCEIWDMKENLLIDSTIYSHSGQNVVVKL